jgi:hypothetical protein
VRIGWIHDGNSKPLIVCACVTEVDKYYFLYHLFACPLQRIGKQPMDNEAKLAPKRMLDTRRAGPKVRTYLGMDISSVPRWVNRFNLMRVALPATFVYFFVRMCPEEEHFRMYVTERHRYERRMPTMVLNSESVIALNETTTFKVEPRVLFTWGTIATTDSKSGRVKTETFIGFMNYLWQPWSKSYTDAEPGWKERVDTLTKKEFQNW